MDKRQIYRLLQTSIKPINIKLDEPMKAHTSFKIGGPADIFVLPSTKEEICHVLTIAREYDVSLFIMGNGTNLLVLDGGIEGIVMKISDNMQSLEINGDMVKAQAGISLSVLSRVLAQSGLGGMEFASGIPGTLGGALVMNAGAYGGEIKDVVKEVYAVDRNGEQQYFDSSNLGFGYRRSIFSRGQYVVLEAVLKLFPADPKHCIEIIEDLSRQRKIKQPLEYPSAGSVFKRPEGYYVGPLIEKAGLKGTNVGDAQVSEKHAGFIINRGNATAKDVLTLIRLIQERVKDMFGIMLEPEIHIVGRG